MKSSQLHNFALLLLLASCWAPSFLFIKIAVKHISPIHVASMRITIAAVLLYLVLRFKKIDLPRFGTVWKYFSVMGFFSCAAPFLLFALGEQYVDSSIAAILNGAVPLFTLLIVHLFTNSDRLTKEEFIGSIIGFLGLFVVVAPSFIETKSTILGMFIISMAAISYAIGFTYTKHKSHELPQSLIVPTGQLIMASLFLLPFSLATGLPIGIWSIPLSAIVSIFSLAILGTAVAFIIYYKLMLATSATYVSAVGYLLPIFGVALGIIILGEELTWNIYLGSAMVLIGVMVMNGILKFCQPPVTTAKKTNIQSPIPQPTSTLTEIQRET